jgi:hypothetical protein
MSDKSMTHSDSAPVPSSGRGLSEAEAVIASAESGSLAVLLPRLRVLRVLSSAPDS